MSLRTIFMGSPEFAVTALAALIEAAYDIICVYSQPPRPAGRGQKEKLSAVHAFAGSSGLMVRTPTSLKETQTQADFLALEADVAVVAAYGLILPPAVLTAPRLGCLNIHASLLPRWRGAAPIQRAIMAGDAETGVTIMAMDAGLDTGDILACERLPIGPETTATDLHDALAALGGRMIVEALANPEPGQPQAAEGVTYAAKLSRKEGRIDWTLSADQIQRRVRALNPWPGLWFDHGGKRIKVLAAGIGQGSGQAGEVLPGGLNIACGSGSLDITKVQVAGRSAMAAADFLRGHALIAGTILS